MPPTLTQSVTNIAQENYLPFPVDTSKLGKWKLEVYYDLSKAFGLSDTAEIENDDTYTPPQKYLIAILISIKAIKFYARQRANTAHQSSGMGTDNGNANQSNTDTAEQGISRIKVADIEIEFDAQGGSDSSGTSANSVDKGASFKSSYEDDLNSLYEEAQLKAENLGFVLDISKATPELIQAFAQPCPIIFVEL